VSCVFCKSEHDLTGEHVFPAALGGRSELAAGTCKNCNNKFNKSFEELVIRSFVPIRNMLFIPDRTGDIPKIEAQVVVEGQRRPAKILAGGQVTVPPMKLQIEKSSNEKEVIYRAFSKDDGKALLANLSARGIKVESAPDGLSEITGEFEWRADFLGSAAARLAVAKIALIGFAYQFGAKAIESEAFSSIKNFITDESQGSPVRLFHNAEFIAHTQAGPHQHMLLFAANKRERTIWAVVILFGGLTYLVQLSSSWDGPDLVKTYGVDAQKGEECPVLVGALENELNAVDLILGQKTIWDDVKVSADSFMSAMKRALGMQ
jgi:hypothetical protein